MRPQPWRRRGPVSSTDVVLAGEFRAGPDHALDQLPVGCRRVTVVAVMEPLRWYQLLIGLGSVFVMTPPAASEALTAFRDDARTEAMRRARDVAHRLAADVETRHLVVDGWRAVVARMLAHDGVMVVAERPRRWTDTALLRIARALVAAPGLSADGERESSMCACGACDIQPVHVPQHFGRHRRHVH